MDREIVLRARHGDRVPLLRLATVLFVVGALVLAVVGLSLLAASTRQPAPIARPAVGLLVTSREGVVSVARPDGTEPRRISPKGMLLRGPQWSTDGTRIAAWGGPIPSTSSIHPGEVYVMDADGGGIRSITPNLEPIFGDALAWSPDDRRIAIASEGRLFVADTDGGRAIELQVEPIPGDMLRTAAMSWSPDGNELAVVVPRAGSDEWGVLEVVDVRTGDVTVVPMAGSLGYASIGQASWSPTGDAIAYVATVRLAGDHSTGQHLMVAVRNDGSWTTSVLVRGPEADAQLFGWPAWSNDGTRLAWVQGDLFGALALWVRSADGSAARKLADLPVSDLGQLGELAWLPDDSRIVVPNVPESFLSFLLVDPDGIAPAWSLEHLGGTADWQTVAR
jgi:Tol biopolymer transport system component